MIALAPALNSPTRSVTPFGFSVAEDAEPLVETRHQRLYPVMKRLTDIIGASIALLLLTPVFILIALAIKLTDGGPIFFTQWRVGKDGQRFRFYKFRSMVVNAEAIKAKLAGQNDHGQSVTFKMRRDPRITAVGRLLRKTSLDEAPQFWNILNGTMSLVGPRPAVVEEVSQYTPTARRRLAVTPGLTGLWQVSGRGNLAFDQQLALDLEYIRRQSWLYDLGLIIRTVPAVVTGRGAY